MSHDCTYQQIEAIPTEYKGYRFRSRLEAKWAVFFDALGIEWEYEPEAFALPGGGGYLPDFWLPTFDGGVYVEVKPRGFGSEKACRFVAAIGRRVWLCDGEPGFSPTRLILRSGIGCGNCSRQEVPGSKYPCWHHKGLEPENGALICGEFSRRTETFTILVVPGIDGFDRDLARSGDEFDIEELCDRRLMHAVARVRGYALWKPTRTTNNSRSGGVHV